MSIIQKIVYMTYGKLYQPLTGYYHRHEWKKERGRDKDKARNQDVRLIILTTNMLQSQKKSEKRERQGQRYIKKS